MTRPRVKCVDVVEGYCRASSPRCPSGLFRAGILRPRVEVGNGTKVPREASRFADVIGAVITSIEAAPRTFSGDAVKAVAY